MNNLTGEKFLYTRQIKGAAYLKKKLASCIFIFIFKFYGKQITKMKKNIYIIIYTIILKYIQLFFLQAQPFTLTKIANSVQLEIQLE